VKSQNQKNKEEKALTKTLLRYEGKRISLFSLLFTWEDGSESAHEIVKHPGAVAILPIDKEGNLIFIQQWRRATEEILIEIPAGTLEPPEPPKDCAIRESQEEIGFKPRSLIPLGGFFTAPGFCNEFIHLFLAQDLEVSHLKAEDTDGIDILTVSLSEALTWALNGKIRDSKTLSALFLYQLWHSQSKR
jgi:ADP-ribose pyrophosphatase